MSKGSNLALAAAGVGVVLIGSKYLRPRMDLHDKVVLITGGSRGLGLAMAEAFARKGAKLAICAVDQEELDRARNHLAP